MNHPQASVETPGIVVKVAPASLAAKLGMQAGDEILQVNGENVEDVIDVLFYAAENDVHLAFRRDGQLHEASGERDEGQPLGIAFAHPTFDIDIRRCNNLCPFCFVLQTAPRMRRTLYIKDDDYRYSFLYGHFVTLTNLSERDWVRIEQQHLSPLYISVHATNLEIRRRCLHNEHAPDIMAQLRWLDARDILCHTQLVVTPGLNDGEHLERSVRDLATLYPTVQSVSVVPVGLTKHHKYGQRTNTRAEAEVVLDTVEAWQQEFTQSLGVPFVHATDEWYLIIERVVPPQADIEGLDLHENGLGQVRGFLDAWQEEQNEVKEKAAQLQNRRATLVTGTLFEPTLTETTEVFNQLANSDLVVAPVLNERLGHSITVAGLLMGEDTIRQLQGRTLGECVILPRVMFDHPQGISLDDLSPLDIARALGVPIYLADLMGDVLDALTGHNSLVFRPTDADIPQAVMRAGGWSLEKYL